MEGRVPRKEESDSLPESPEERELAALESALNGARGQTCNHALIETEGGDITQDQLQAHLDKTHPNLVRAKTLVGPHPVDSLLDLSYWAIVQLNHPIDQEYQSDLEVEIDGETQIVRVTIRPIPEADTLDAAVMLVEMSDELKRRIESFPLLDVATKQKVMRTINMLLGPDVHRAVRVQQLKIHSNKQIILKQLGIKSSSAVLPSVLAQFDLKFLKDLSDGELKSLSSAAVLTVATAITSLQSFRESINIITSVGDDDFRAMVAEFSDIIIDQMRIVIANNLALIEFLQELDKTKDTLPTARLLRKYMDFRNKHALVIDPVTVLLDRSIPHAMKCLGDYITDLEGKQAERDAEAKGAALNAALEFGISGVFDGGPMIYNAIKSHSLKAIKWNELAILGLSATRSGVQLTQAGMAWIARAHLQKFLVKAREYASTYKLVEARLSNYLENLKKQQKQMGKDKFETELKTMVDLIVGFSTTLRVEQKLLEECLEKLLLLEQKHRSSPHTK